MREQTRHLAPHQIVRGSVHANCKQGQLGSKLKRLEFQPQKSSLAEPRGHAGPSERIVDEEKTVAKDGSRIRSRRHLELDHYTTGTFCVYTPFCVSVSEYQFKNLSFLEQCPFRPTVISVYSLQVLKPVSVPSLDPGTIFTEFHIILGSNQYRHLPDT